MSFASMLLFCYLCKYSIKNFNNTSYALSLDKLEKIPATTYFISDKLDLICYSSCVNVHENFG